MGKQTSVDGRIKQAMASPRYLFSEAPDSQDFERLASYLEQEVTESLHPALCPQRHEVASGLRRMAGAPHEAAHRGAYHALRLFVH